MSVGPAPQARSGPEIIIAGHSHVFAMGVRRTSAEELRLEEIPDTQGQFFGVVEPFSGGREPPYWFITRKHAKGRVVAIVWNGNQHNLRFLLARKTPFDFYCRGDANEPILPGARIVPRTVVEHYLLPSVRGLDGIIPDLKAAGASRIVLVGTPSIKADASFFLPAIKTSAGYVAIAEKLGISVDEIEITPAQVRQKLWQVIQDQLRDLAAAHDVDFMPVPADTLEADGTLKREYWQPQEATHANAAYGKRLRRALAEFVSKPRGSA